MIQGGFLMSKKKKYIISALALATIVIIIFLMIRSDEWSPPTEAWWIRFESIDELNEAIRLSEVGNEAELLAFIEGTNNGENIIEDGRAVEYLVDILNDTILPVDTSWTSLSYNTFGGNIFVSYELASDIRLSFIFEARDGTETFSEMMAKDADDFIDIDITHEIKELSTSIDSNEDSLRIGHGVEAFAFYNEFGDYSIYEWEGGWEVRVSLNIDGVFASARIDRAPNQEAAFEILANVEFSRGGKWFDSE